MSHREVNRCFTYTHSEPQQNISVAAEQAWRPGTTAQVAHCTAAGSAQAGDAGVLDCHPRPELDRQQFAEPFCQREAFREFHDGQRELDRSMDHLRNALDSLNSGDKESARRDLVRSLHKINQGVDDLGDGLALPKNHSDSDRHGEEEIGEGMRDLKGVKQEIRFALKSMKDGQPCDAREALQEAMKDFRGADREVDHGIDLLCADFPPPRRGEAGAGGAGHDDGIVARPGRLPAPRTRELYDNFWSTNSPGGEGLAQSP